MSKLARVLDPEELDRAEGSRGRFVLDLPEAWLEAGGAIELVVPARVTCARCDGGGCDDCGRSGGLRLGGDELARTLQLALPAATHDFRAARSIVRLARPLGASAELDQLWIELRPAPEPSPFCKRVPHDRGRTRGVALLAREPMIVSLLVALALLLLAYAGLR